MKPNYTSANNKGEGTIYRVLAHMPRTMGREEEKHSARGQVLRPCQCLLRFPGILLIISMHLSQPSVTCFKVPSLTLTRGLSCGSVPAGEESRQTWQVRPLTTPQNLLVTNPDL